MQKLVEYITKSIVQKPDEISLEKEEGEEIVQLRLKVDPDDIKFVIGKKGRTIRAIRNLLRIKAIKENKRVNLDLIETTEAPASK